jgi:hypothetical protein
MIRLPAPLDNKSSLPKLDDDKLLGLASMLVDEAYGSFDRCYSLIRVVRGDLTAARDLLSKLIIFETMF